MNHIPKLNAKGAFNLLTHSLSLSLHCCKIPWKDKTNHKAGNRI